HEDVQADPGEWRRLGERLQEIRAATGRNVAVFLPSHDALHRLAPYVRGATSFVEVRGASQGRLMADLAAFKATRGATLVSVVGGRLSEGLDFPDEQLEVVVIVGLPYARPTAKVEALVRFYDRKFGRGWEWAVKVPMARRVLQAAGRLIRTPTDRGVVVLLDRRAASLRDVLPDARTTEDPAAEVRAFFGG
ncbi:MAG TPA: helicase C-terminal domain-containing protein, partial [Candidatus Thermoplasmatota archaeon]|nr:helicase C-terminal domain-containing protein [Candidatus Thermoplasmatota archaeon]